MGGLAVLTLPCLLYSMDLTVLHLAVPQLSADLKPSSAQLLWIIDIYGFLVAGSLITMGTLGVVLVDAARSAFVRGLQLTAAISTVGTVLLAIFTAVVLRSVGGSPTAEAAPDPHDDRVADRRTVAPVEQRT